VSEKLECLEGNEDDASVKEIRRIRLGESFVKSGWRKRGNAPDFLPFTLLYMPMPRGRFEWFLERSIRKEKEIDSSST